MRTSDDYGRNPTGHNNVFMSAAGDVLNWKYFS